MNAAKSGYVAEFVTGYLQREITFHKAIVTGGTDAGLNDQLVKGYAPGRLVNITLGDDGIYVVSPAEDVVIKGNRLVSKGTATHIIAQSDDTVRNFPSDTNYTERYSYLPNLICKNDAEPKAIAVYKIVNIDDIKMVKITEPVEVVTAANVSGTFTKGATTYQFMQTGINTFKVIGTIPYVAQGDALETGNKGFAGNFMYLKLTDAEITTADQYNAATTDVKGTDIVYKRNSGIFPVNEVNKTAIATEIGTNGGIEIEVALKADGRTAREVTIDVMWRTGVFTTYTFDVSEVEFGGSN